MFKKGNTIFAIILLLPALYLIVWCCMNPELAGEYIHWALILILLAAIILVGTYWDAKNKKRAEEDAAQDEVPEEIHEKTPEEIAAERGIELSRVPYKSKAVAAFLCLFGIFGLHRVYLGKLKSGLAMMFVSLLTWWTIITVIWLLAFTISDLVSIVRGEMKDSYNRPLV